MSSNLISIGLSGLNAAQWGLTTTGQNISNASTPGYESKRRSMRKAPASTRARAISRKACPPPRFSAQYSQYLTTELNNCAVDKRFAHRELHDALAAEQHGRRPDHGHLQRDHQLFHRFAERRERRLEPATRQTAMSDAQSLANQMNAAGTQYDQLRQSVNTQLTNTVSQINSYTAQIAALNQQITPPARRASRPTSCSISAIRRSRTCRAGRRAGGANRTAATACSCATASRSWSARPATTSAPRLRRANPANVDHLSRRRRHDADRRDDDNLPDSSMENRRHARRPARVPQPDRSTRQKRNWARSPPASPRRSTTRTNSVSTLNGNAGGALFSVAPPAATANTNNTGTAALSVSFVNAAQPTTSNYTLSYNGNSYTLTDNATGSVVGIGDQSVATDRRPEFLVDRHDERRRFVQRLADERRARQLRAHHDQLPRRLPRLRRCSPRPLVAIPARRRFRKVRCPRAIRCPARRPR